ncbi:hypothetical protein AX14_009487 [Amanita brunnescens Koide BX004]|nr:hypothetical protein AX14_009487 [Amanita brunnescens Koide BX004]
MSFHTRQTVSSKCLKENRTAFDFDHLPLESAMMDWIHEKRHLPGPSMDSNIRTCYKRTRRKTALLSDHRGYQNDNGFLDKVTGTGCCILFLIHGSRKRTP